MRPLTAHERVKLLTASFDERDARLGGRDPLGFDGYERAVERARDATGLREAALWGWADIDGVPCVLVVFDFRFLGGSMGVAVGEKVARAFDAARSAQRPVVAVTASGGARMQEGMAALAQMAKTAEARRRHAAAGLGQVTLLTSPTTGGVYASFGSLADVVLAEQGAQLGFAGPRVVRELTGRRPPKDVHTAEFAYEHGLVDAIVSRRGQAKAIGRVLRGLTPSPESPAAGRVVPGATSRTPTSAWERVGIARDPARPKARDVLDALLTNSFELRGDRCGGGDDPAVVAALGALTHSGVRVVALGCAELIAPAGFRKAQRALAIAGRIGLPVVSIVDTRGADPGPGAEGAGVASAIAETFTAMLGCPAPTMAVLTGEGGSGGALALAAADRVIAWEHAFFSVVAPEGAAQILYRDSSRAPELAGRLGIVTEELVRLGIVDAVVSEPAGGAQTKPRAALKSLADAVGAELDELRAAPARSRLAARRRRWRRAGNEWLRLG